jgi:hypothetical protein
MHQIYWGSETEFDDTVVKQDGSGRFQYLTACRKFEARPNIPALMMMSGTSLLLHNYGMQMVDAKALAMGLAVNAYLTEVNLSSNMLGDGAVDLARAIGANSVLKKLVMQQVGVGMCVCVCSFIYVLAYIRICAMYVLCEGDS